MESHFLYLIAPTNLITYQPETSTNNKKIRDNHKVEKPNVRPK
jgi:hypothetical protein